MLEVDWAGARPRLEQIKRIWSSKSFDVVDINAEKVDSYVDSMAETRTRGDARWCCIEIPESPELDWFAARNCLADAGFFRQLLSSEAVASELGISAAEPNPSFTVESGLTLDGILAEQLVHGGSKSYGDTVEQQYGTFARAKGLAEDCRDEIIEDRYEEVTVHRTREAWADWFGKPEWNVTLVAVDRRYRWAWVLVATDEGLLETAAEQASD